MAVTICCCHDVFFVYPRSTVVQVGMYIRPVVHLCTCVYAVVHVIIAYVHTCILGMESINILAYCYCVE